ncbi:MAG: hypothetical protein JRG80_01990 [Deltaproteobacteria bacterium]|nr:hypothetical protein [Deltaproteobacteria bacterium]MBW2398023.1 hypothetical protein [Deltaproteobacteria bacterium]MBW2665532.1 hypothetical protein [Deltaproteobacteria bacterium]
MTISVNSLGGARQGLRRVGMLVALTIAFQASPGLAANDTAREAGVGVGAAFGSLLYAPAKLVYATLGLVLGGMAWGLSGGDADVKDAVIMPAVRGDYVITPSIIRGEEKLEFVGRRPGYGRDDQIVAEEIEEGF